MYLKKLRLAIGSLSIGTLAACGGGSSNELIGSPAASPTPASQSFSISGNVFVAANILHDSDINDPNTNLIDNDTPETAQVVNNLLTINGFLSHEPTAQEGDAFRFASDQIDNYRVFLQAGQQLELAVLDIAADSPELPDNDLDLALFDLNMDLIQMSDSTGALERIIVPNDGEYFIQVLSSTGKSKYVLTLDADFAINLASQHSYAIPAKWVIPNQALVKSDPAKISGLNKMHMKVNAGYETQDGPHLVEFNFDSGLQKASAPENAFLSSLRQSNPSSYQKYKTLLAIKELAQNHDVEYASPNFIRKSLLIPNDPNFQFQWHYPSMNLPQAWDITTGTPATGEVIVAVVDTGVVLSHPELDDQLVPGFDFISNSTNARDGDGIDANPDDAGDSEELGQSSWHGTHVAGTIAAESNNGVGVAGVSFGAKIMPLRVLGAQGGTSADIIQALLFAARRTNTSGTLPEQAADIINLSLGGAGSSAAEAAVYQELFDQGIIVVAAAGNDNSDALSFPASYPGVISVAALDAANARAPYSNFGSEVDIAAPGGNVRADLNNDGFGDGVLSTFINDITGAKQPNFSFLNGTSMASPHIAGMFALMKAVNPALTAQDIETLLIAGSLTRDAGDIGRDDIFGHGIADALLAVRAAEALLNNGNEQPQLPAVIQAAPSQITIGTANTATLEIRNIGDASTRLQDVINPSAPWMQVTADTVDASGLGTYRIDINRDNLIPGTYLTTLRFIFDSANELRVNVSTKVGDTQNASEVPQLTVSLVDSTSDNVVASVFAVEGADNTFSYEFSDVSPGIYKILTGSDIDNDARFCQPGEVCGRFPEQNSLNPGFTVDADRRNVDITVNIVPGL